MAIEDDPARANFQHAQGIEMVLASQIEDAERQIEANTLAIDHLIRQREIIIHETAHRDEYLTKETKETEVRIRELQHLLSDHFPDDVLPDLLIDDPENKYYAEAAKAHSETLNSLSFAETQKVTRAMDELDLLSGKIFKLINERKGFDKETSTDGDDIAKIDKRLNKLRNDQNRFQTELDTKMKMVPKGGFKTLSKNLSKTIREQQKTITQQDGDASATESKVLAYDKYFQGKQNANRVELLKAHTSVGNDARPMDKAAAKLNAMGDELFDEPIDLLFFKDREKSTHAKEMIALRAGHPTHSRKLRVKVLDRGPTTKNVCTVEIHQNKRIVCVTDIAIEMDGEQHDKLVVSTALNFDKMWREAEQNTEGVPPGLDQIKRQRPKNLKLFANTYHRLINENIEESRRKAG